MTKWRVVVDVVRVRERVRRLYVARISNKLSADPLARSFIITSRACLGARGRAVISACVRACVGARTRACGRHISCDFETSMHACVRTSTRRAKTVAINDVTAQ